MVKLSNWINYDELARYRAAVTDYLDGDLSEENFQAVRLQQGVYGQRQNGVNMIRVKLPGGCITSQQLMVVADLLSGYSHENIASVTTRQDLQLHSIPLVDTPQVLEQLANCGLTSRESCGNTVRNITACPLAGVCPAEHMDVQPIVDVVAERFMRHPLTQYLPRKFKMSFSGCEADCAQGLFHDLAVIAICRNGRFGYKVLAAGGLGHKPRAGIVIEEYIEEKDLLPVIEAMLALHHRYSDRKRRARARLKFLLERLGAEQFIQKYREELSRTRAAYADELLPISNWVRATDKKHLVMGVPREVLEQKQLGYFIFPISLPLGDLNVEQLRGIATLLCNFSLDYVRVTQDQNLILLHIPARDLESVREALTILGLDSPCRGDDVVACPGTWTCRLGITSSRLICKELSGGTYDLRIRVSGCHNGCAQPYVGDIGLHGEGRRKHGKLIPHYRLHFGGDGRNEGSMAIRGPEIPVSRTPQAVHRVKQMFHTTRQRDENFRQWARRQGESYFTILLQDLTVVHGNELEYVLKDYGGQQDFRVESLGGGECMGAVQNFVLANFSETAHEREYRRVFQLAKKTEQALDCVEAITRLVAQVLVHVAGGNTLPNSLSELSAALIHHYDNESLTEPLVTFRGELARLRILYDEASFLRMADMQDAWTLLAAYTCCEHDPTLDLQALLPEATLLAKVI